MSSHEAWEDVPNDSKLETYYDRAYNNTRQLDYYKSLGVTTSNNSGIIKRYNNSNSIWWLRTAVAGSDDFMGVHNSGGLFSGTSTNTSGLAPSFRIG